MPRQALKLPILPIDILSITSRVSKGERLLKVLGDMEFNAIDFFKHLDETLEDKILFNTARKISLELVLDESEDLLDHVENKTDLEIAKAKINLRQWMAEKLIPETYGTKIQHDHKGTINIRAALGEMDERIEAGRRLVKPADIVIPTVTRNLPEPVQTSNKPEDIDIEDLM
jgi:hypothetical protein